MAQVASFDVGVLFVIVVTASLTNGSSSSRHVVHRREVEAAGLNALQPAAAGSNLEVTSCPTCDQLRPKRRAKRCTCYTYKDKECVYYCHLDIIWINTPEHTVPYGISSSWESLRMPRSVATQQGMTRAEAQRCTCTLKTDSECSHFCMDRQKRAPAAGPQTD
ncbi:endothelin-1 [Thalassophryne amazonica]|uniref:endothelin-1 n=1 Tax=Thalassophryne amazonica TaxID=390379 RepID=UPI001471CD64|nr:endothelin-1 [Thalassophryne amazonica]